MSRALIVTSLAVATLAAPAAAGIPRTGTLVPGRALGGVRLGETQKAVRSALGPGFGICDDCARQTWYFTYQPFKQQGLGVEFQRRRVVAVYTLWQPVGWHATNGVRLGATPLQVHDRAGPLRGIACDGYESLVVDTPTSRTAYYVYNGSLWGFGLFAANRSPCR